MANKTIYIEATDIANLFQTQRGKRNSRKDAKSMQKQPSTVVLLKRCFENIQRIYRGTTMPKCNFLG